MKAGARMWLLVVLLLALPASVAAAPPETLDATVRELMAKGAGPGIAVGIIERGEVTWAKGYGTKRAGTDAPVTPATLFEIGSTTKAFTSAALALLVDEGRIGWDDRVIDHLPEFRMYDPWVTREMTVRDLLAHRSGLGAGAGNLAILPNTDQNRGEIVAALRHIKPTSSFRSAYAYNNLMYVVAGQLVEQVSGVSWEVFVRDRLLRPVGMSRTLTTLADRANEPDRAQPHRRFGPPMSGMGPLTSFAESDGIGQNLAPAGAIVSSVDDMLRWVRVQLRAGDVGDGTHLWSAPRAREMWAVVMPIPVPVREGSLADAAPRFAGYALGWSVQDYGGERVVLHAGGTMGHTSLIVLLPDRDVGFVLLQNSVEIGLLRALQYVLLDHYIGRPAADWPQRMAEAQDAANRKAVEALADFQPPARPAPATLPVVRLAADYVDPWYGKVAVTIVSGQPQINMTRTRGMRAALAHYSGDTYVARWDNRMIEPSYVSFVPTRDGRVAQMTLRAASPLGDFSGDYESLDLRPVHP
ncbi:serine hydrolase [Sphingobium algorifonticola]|uniref:Serine hydrolase n=1 Tax=Sphingobium algorifonticola TaxID=2008318 RepID=A0A437J5S0_9SPHN|nr:serine hydrolase [Sphingobium algorifonticola]RVT40267.1 serine hydrolase [Sphingobium algorifonticola]